MNLSFFAIEPHHKKHAQAIADGFGLKVLSNLDEITTDYVAVFCYGDLKRVNTLNKKIIYCDHGTGLFYNEVHPSYAGSLEARSNVVLRLSPNETHAEKERETLKCPVVTVGVPKLDKYANRNWNIKKHKPTIALSFHWDCMVNPETRTSFAYFERILPILRAKYKVIGHGHPRIIESIRPYYRKHGIIVEESFHNVMTKADVYICDNSSTIFEWGITEKPIVLLNPPFYRKNIEHKGNPRFWKHSGIGPICEDPKDIIKCVEDSLLMRDTYRPLIRNANKDVLGFTDGKCIQRAVDAIKKHIPCE